MKNCRTEHKIQWPLLHAVRLHIKWTNKILQNNNHATGGRGNYIHFDDKRLVVFLSGMKKPPTFCHLSNASHKRAQRLCREVVLTTVPSHQRLGQAAAWRPWPGSAWWDNKAPNSPEEIIDICVMWGRYSIYSKDRLWPNRENIWLFLYYADWSPSKNSILLVSTTNQVAKIQRKW